MAITPYPQPTKTSDLVNDSGYRRVETFSGTTNASGDYTVVFTSTYTSAPDIQAQLLPPTTANQTVRVTAISTTGCTVKVEQRNAVSLLGVDVLSATAEVVSGASVSVQVTSRTV